MPAFDTLTNKGAGLVMFAFKYTNIQNVLLNL